MASKATVDQLDAAELHDRLVAVMKDLRLASPEKMLARIEGMISKRDRESVLRQLLAGCEAQSRADVKRTLNEVARSSDDWHREVDRLFAGYPPTR